MSPVSIHPRGNGGTCIRCRKKFERGDRVLIVNIIERVGPNPSNPREIGSWLSEEFEVSHADCADPTINGTILVGGR